MMSSTGNDVWGAVQYFTVCVWGEGECVWGEGNVCGGEEECVCVSACVYVHSTADAWAVLSAMDPHSLPLAYIQ